MFLVLYAVGTAMKLVVAVALAPLGVFVGILIYPAAVVAIFYLRGKYLYSYEIVAIIIYILMLTGLFGTSEFVVGASILVLGFLPFLFADYRAVVKRIIFVLIGFTLVIALSEVSKAIQQWGV